MSNLNLWILTDEEEGRDREISSKRNPVRIICKPFTSAKQRIKVYIKRIIEAFNFRYNRMSTDGSYIKNPAPVCEIQLDDRGPSGKLECF